jgi:glycosyltransferase involved in cell wall biosynthesis
VKGEILFYSDFPFGFHNTEAEEKMARFAARGWRVVYVEQLGIRNPRPRHVLRALKARRSSAGGGKTAPFEVVSPKLLPPRRVPGVDAVNRGWLDRQLVGHVQDPHEAVLWIRFPTPELVQVVRSHPWRAVVYEVVDDHAVGPGMTSRLRLAFNDAEAEIIASSDLVFAWSEPIRERLAGRHPNVRLATAAVDVDALEAVAGVEGAERTAVFTGELGFRFDEQLAAAVAERLPDWTFLLAGPASPEAEAALAGRANAILSGRFRHEELPGLLGLGRVCVVPYKVNPFNDNLVPVKLVEYLAAGRPVVSTPMKGAEGFADAVAFAAGADAFAEAVRAAERDDSPEARRGRVDYVRPYTWERRIDEMESAIEAVVRD